jgi:hypothetical protein
MGFFDFLKSDDPEPQLTIESTTTKPKKLAAKRGRGSGTEPAKTTEPDVFDEGRELRNRNKNPNDMRSSGGIKGELEKKTGDNYDPMTKGSTEKPMFRKSNNELMNEKEQLKDKLKNDDRPNLDDINARLAAINNEQKKRANKLRKDLNNEDLTLTDLANMINNKEDVDTSVLTPDEQSELVDILQGKRDRYEGGGDLGDDTIEGGSIGNQLLDQGEEMLPSKQAEEINTSENIAHGAEKMKQEELATVHPDATVDIEAGEATFSTTTNDPFIERGKENSPDTGIFSSMLHVGTKISYEYLKKSSGYEDIINIAEQFTPFELKSVVNTAINTLQTTRVDEIGSLRASSSKRMKFNIEDKKHDVVHNPVLYPFLVIALNFYMVKNEAPYMQFNWMMNQGLSVVLKSMGLDSRNVNYFTSIYNAFPSSLNTAFMRNANGIASVEDGERQQIKSFVELCIRDYNAIFTPNTFTRDVRKYEAGGMSLLSILQNLQNPQMLFEINQTFSTVDNFLTNVEENKDILIGLMGLIYAQSRSQGDLVGAAMINSAMVDGIVYYNNPSKTQEKQLDENIELMLEMEKSESERQLEGYDIKYNSDKLSEFDKNGDTTILFKGSNFKEEDFMKKDFIQNILNFAGSREIFLDEEYNTRYQQAIKLILDKQREIDNTGTGSLKIQGYSIGGIGAMYVSVLFPDVPVKVYSPIISDTPLTNELINELVDRESNIEFFAIEGDPISSNLEKYKDKLKINYVKKNKFFNAHSLNNYKFI